MTVSVKENLDSNWPQQEPNFNFWIGKPFFFFFSNSFVMEDGEGIIVPFLESQSFVRTAAGLVSNSPRLWLLQTRKERRSEQQQRLQNPSTAPYMWGGTEKILFFNFQSISIYMRRGMRERKEGLFRISFWERVLDVGHGTLSLLTRNHKAHHFHVFLKIFTCLT